MRQLCVSMFLGDPEFSQFVIVQYNVKVLILLGCRCHSKDGLFPIPIVLSVGLSVWRVVYCGQTVQDKHVVCIEVKYECCVDISIGTIFDNLGPP